MSKWIGLFAGLLLCGCVYEVPLVDEAVVLIDPEVTGTWQMIPQEGEPEDPTAQLVILPFSRTEYVVIGAPAKKDRLVFRGYPGHINGLEIVQLEWLQAGPEQNRYHVCRYTISEDGRLAVQMLSTDVVSDLITDPDELRKILVEQCRNPKMFSEPQIYRRMNGQ